MITFGTCKFYMCTAIEYGGVGVGLRGSKPRETEAAYEKYRTRRVIRYEFIIGFNATVFEAAKRSQSRW